MNFLIAQGELLPYAAGLLTAITAFVALLLGIPAMRAKRIADRAAARVSDVEVGMTALREALERSDKDREKLEARVVSCERNVRRLVRQIRRLGAIPDLEGV